MNSNPASETGESVDITESNHSVKQPKLIKNNAKGVALINGESDSLQDKPSSKASISKLFNPKRTSF